MSNVDSDSRDKLRFSYLITPESVADYDRHAGQSAVTLSRLLVKWPILNPDAVLVDGSDEAREQEALRRIFPDGLSLRVGKHRGKRIVEVPFHIEGNLLIPPDYSYQSFVLKKDSSDRYSAVLSPQNSEVSRVHFDSANTQNKRHKRPFIEISSVDYQNPLVATLSSSVLSESTDEVVDGTHALDEPIIYLFNVIVALEWEPDEADKEMLSYAFRRASDFLYDVSDGTLAFGQVIFGMSPEIRQAADIVIAASNRLQGRSWVGGLHIPSKHMPIRIGRGHWSQGLSIPWDEPEGYRLIIHEWAHYALHLHDAYLHRLSVAPTPRKTLISREPEEHINITIFTADTTEQNRASRDNLQEGPDDPDITHILIPKGHLVGLSVMEMLDGVSEFALSKDKDEEGFNQERESIRAIYPSGNSRSLNKISNGPRETNLGLPHILFEGITLGASVLEWNIPKGVFETLNLRSPTDFDRIHDCVLYDSCWIYVMSAKEALETKFIAQGTLEMRSAVRPFRLLGAGHGDRVAAVVTGPDGCSRVYIGNIDAPYSTQSHIRIEFKKMRCVDSPPIVVVWPVVSAEDEKISRKNAVEQPCKLDKLLEIQVKIELRGVGVSMPDEIWICPLLEPVRVLKKDDQSGLFQFDNLSLRGLDGHVVLWFGETPIISCFSHGGNPPTHDIQT